jgi:hypothetical protein
MTNAIGGSYAVNNNPYSYQNALTPDALMIYLSTRLGGVDDQIQAIFKEQQEADKVRQLVNELKRSLNELNVDTNEDKVIPAAAGTMQNLQTTLDELAKIAPTLARDMEAKLKQTGHILYEDANNGTFEHTTREVKNTQEYLDNVTSDLESASQMNMIHLQSLMSGRQTAISLSTNLISKLHDSTQKVVDNIR